METVAIKLPFHNLPPDRRKAVMNNSAPPPPPLPPPPLLPPSSPLSFSIYMWFKMVGSCGWINAGSGREREKKKEMAQLRIHQHCIKKDTHKDTGLFRLSYLFIFLSVSVNDHPAGSVSPAFCNSSTFIITTPTGLQGSNNSNKTPDTMDHREPGGIK